MIPSLLLSGFFLDELVARARPGRVGRFTRWDTLVLPLVTPPNVELLTCGRGYVQLDIGTLRLTDALAAPALPALANALARLPGGVVGHREDYEGW